MHQNYADLTNESKIAVFTRSSFKRPEKKTKVYLFSKFFIFSEPSRTHQSNSAEKGATKIRLRPPQFFEIAFRTYFCSKSITNSKEESHQQIFKISTTFHFQGDHREFCCTCEHSETIKREPWRPEMNTARKS